MLSMSRARKTSLAADTALPSISRSTREEGEGEGQQTRWH